jgi:hypothetical protein
MKPSDDAFEYLKDLMGKVQKAGANIPENQEVKVKPNVTKKPVTATFTRHGWRLLCVETMTLTSEAGGKNKFYGIKVWAFKVMFWSSFIS